MDTAVAPGVARQCLDADGCEWVGARAGGRGQPLEDEAPIEDGEPLFTVPRARWLAKISPFGSNPKIPSSHGDAQCRTSHVGQEP